MTGITVPAATPPAPAHAIVSVALYLTIVSVVEWMVVSRHGPDWLMTVVLLGALVAKLAGVSLIYMGLYQAPRVLRAAVAFVAVMVVYGSLMMVVPTLKADSGPLQETGPLLAGRPDIGRMLMSRFECTHCHAVPGLAPPVHGLCPDLAGVADRAGSREPGRSAEAYLRESIEEPDAYVVAGYLPWMPALRSKMTGQEFEDIVAFLMTLHQQEPPGGPGEGERTGIWRTK